jgi:hypothetical protein
LLLQKKTNKRYIATMSETGEEVDKPTALVQPRRRVRSHSLRPRADSAIFTGIPEEPDGGDQLMGPILRRKRVSSVPLGVDPRHAEFFGNEGPIMARGRHSVMGMAQLFPSQRVRQSSGGSFSGRVRQASGGSMRGGQSPHESPRPRRRQSSLMQGILRRKQVSLDLVAVEDDDDFFAPLVPADEVDVMPAAPEGEEMVIEATAGTEDEAAGKTPEPGKEVVKKPAEPEVKLFKPLVFSKPLKMKKGGGGGGHGAGGSVDEDVIEALEIQFEDQQKLKKHLDQLVEDAQSIGNDEMQGLVSSVRQLQEEVEADTEALQYALGLEKVPQPEESQETNATVANTGMETLEEKPEEEEEEGEKPRNIQERGKMFAPKAMDIKKAGRGDFIQTAILICIMIAFTGVVLGWHTEIDEEFSVFGPVGLACSTQCLGHHESQNYFRAHSHFEQDEFIQVTVRLDPHPDEEAHAMVQIVGAETGHVKALKAFGPPEVEEHAYFEEDFEVDSSWDHPHEEHLINIFSVYEDTELKHLNCTTPCMGDVEEQNYFSHEDSSFRLGEYIQLVMQVYPTENESNHENTLVNADIVGVESGEVKATATFGPAHHDKPEYFVSTIEVGFDNPDEEHVINVYSTDEEVSIEFTLSAYTNNNTVLSFALHATTLQPVAKYSELIAALIMILVYLFILLETIHRTLVAIFGSMVALFFFFLMHGVSTRRRCRREPVPVLPICSLMLTSICF